MQSGGKTASTKDLGFAFEHIKELHMMICALMTDVAALRQTLLKDKVLARRYKHRLGVILKESRPLVEAAVQAYDEAICRIQTAGQMRN